MNKPISNTEFYNTYIKQQNERYNQITPFELFILCCCRILEKQSLNETINLKTKHQIQKILGKRITNKLIKRYQQQQPKQKNNNQKELTEDEIIKIIETLQIFGFEINDQIKQIIKQFNGDLIKIIDKINEIEKK